MRDSFGFMAEGVLAVKFVSVAATAGASNSWNPVGWVILAIVLLIVVGFAIFYSAKAIKRAQQNALVQATLLMNYASTAATPPPPNKGGKGTKVTSKTLYNKRGKNGYQIDVENPGNRVGQIHLQKNGVKYYYESRGINFVFRCINRLDRDTTGLVVIAKNMLSAAAMNAAMINREIHRTYLAVVKGELPESGILSLNPCSEIRFSTIQSKIL